MSITGITDLDPIIIDNLDPPAILCLSATNTYYLNLMTDLRFVVCNIKYDLPVALGIKSQLMIKWILQISDQKTRNLDKIMPHLNVRKQYIEYITNLMCEYNSIDILQHPINLSEDCIRVRNIFGKHFDSIFCDELIKKHNFMAIKICNYYGTNHTSEMYELIRNLRFREASYIAKLLAQQDINKLITALNYAIIDFSNINLIAKSKRENMELGMYVLFCIETAYVYEIKLNVNIGECFEILCHVCNVDQIKQIIAYGKQIGYSFATNIINAFGVACMGAYNNIEDLLSLPKYLLEFAEKEYGKIDIHSDNEHAFYCACLRPRMDIAKWLIALGEDSGSRINIHAVNSYAFRYIIHKIKKHDRKNITDFIEMGKYLIELSEGEYGRFDAKYLDKWNECLSQYLANVNKSAGQTVS